MISKLLSMVGLEVTLGYDVNDEIGLKGQDDFVGNLVIFGFAQSRVLGHCKWCSLMFKKSQ